MRYKYKLSFSVLMISSCLVQSASAVESRNRELTRLENVENGGTVPKGSALISHTFSNKVTIEDGGVEIVDNGRISVGSTINKGGMQIVVRGGNAFDAKVLGGQQFVHEEPNIDLTSVVRRSSAYNTSVSGGGGAVGQQNVYDGAWALNTKVGNNGEQNLYAGEGKKGGKAMTTEVSENGRQHVLALGESLSTTLKDHATQVVYPGGFVDTLTIMDYAQSWLYANAQEVVGEVRVNNHGELYLFAGDVTNHLTKKKIPIEGRPEETIFEVGERNNKYKPQIEIEDLGGQDGTVVFTSIPYDPRHISLHVEKLSGNLHFRFNISTAWDSSDYLTIGEGSGNHKISVADSGREITGSLSQRNSFVTHLPLVTDRSQGGGANFTLADLSGREITTFDGGTYQYRLEKRDRCASSSGSSTTWYLSRVSEGAGRTNSEVECVNKKAKVPVALSDQSTPSRRKNTGPKNPPKKEQPQKRPPRHLREAQSVSSVSISSSQENQMHVVLPPSPPHSLSSDTQQAAVSASSQSLADQMILRPSNQKQPSPQLDETLSGFQFLTTPSTDAVLSMSVAPVMIFYNEMQSVRAGRGILDKSKKHTALWGYAIKAKESIATEHIDFKLDQTGIVLGINGLSEWENGEFYIGGFGSYDHARVAHTRGGTSGINSYSIGAYVTYVDHSGWYLDALLKYNHYQNNLKAVSTNGLGIEGSYKQWAVGASFEAGYRFQTSKSSWLQPYGQFTWLQVEGKEIKLSNDMSGDIRPFTSLRSEVGLSLGYEFGSGMATSSQAYITAAWLRENKDDNQTVINEHHSFTTDLSGNAGKLGIGLSSFLSEKLKLYGEAHYVKGRKTKQSLQGIIGVRYNF
ncbi:BafA family autotransporter [Bartonella krasnovii]|uniref:BafA family autotransporter n=1 Tax=Bartonella krasnovii TaxID=2267275 RepID=A0ABY3VY90_9HYPH|nr:BafA family autotransporter [Bartonella krasnovii]UNF29610.1 BafA family autotransporter [Bartonella krasnovii]UNF35969.1 BafA family autotransporter [Bartonella krasnovii]UNF40998.1 BafA family autotransporter [Bartonella krasnovii]UNF49156.1 BafA family autotransporter [Bartonella krasnovii]